LDVRISLDMDLQTRAEALLADLPGAIVLLDAQNGQVLTMASNPQFDPNQLEETWETLVNDENAPLINRATLGRYQPGATLGPFLLAASGKLGELPESITNYEFTFGETTIPCTSTPADNTWEATIVSGCGGPLSTLGLELGTDVLLNTFQIFGFYNAPSIRLDASAQIAPATIATPGAAAAGQGELRISPMQLALAGTAFSNRGTIPAPQFLLEIENPHGGWDVYPVLSEPSNVFNSTIANKTANALADDQLPIWQTTALAFNGPELPLSWYIGGTLPGAEKPMVVVVLLETNAPGLAQIIGQKLLIVE
jgi:peptidoglycan glycosyltransferase